MMKTALYAACALLVAVAISSVVATHYAWAGVDEAVKDWTISTDKLVKFRTQDDTQPPRPYVIIQRDGDRIISIDVYPPPGVAVNIHRESKP